MEPQSKINHLGVFKILDFSPIFSRHTYCTMYPVNSKPFRLKKTSEFLISRHYVQNTTFEISPFKVSILVSITYVFSLKIVEKCLPSSKFFSDDRSKANDKEKTKKNTQKQNRFFHPTAQIVLYLKIRMVGFAWWLHIQLLCGFFSYEMLLIKCVVHFLIYELNLV